MGFKKTNITVDEINTMLGIMLEDLNNAKTWSEHNKIVEKAEQPTTEDEVLTVVDKLGLLIDSTLDALNDGTIELETGTELLDVTKAVAIYQDLV